MWIDEFEDYKLFLKAHLRTYPKKGRGQLQRIAKHLNVAPITVSQVVSGDRHFTPDQAIQVTKYLGLDDRTSEYFIYLVNFSRAESRDLKKFYSEKLQHLQKESARIKNLVQGTGALTEAERGIYYSNWYYVAVRTLSAIPKYQTVEAMSDYLQLPRVRVGEVVSFLLETGLCIEHEKGKIRPGQRQIHVDDKNPFVNSHRRNWREKAREKFTNPGEEDFFYSSVVTLSESDAAQFRKVLLQLIQDFSKRVRSSPEETQRCMNIDWFKF